MEYKFDLNFIGTLILPLIATVASFVFFFLQKSRRHISYRIVSITKLPTYDKPVSELTNPNKKIVIEYINSGNSALETSDFYKSVTTKFINAQLLNAENYKSSYDIISKKIKLYNSSATFVPDQMNPNDSIYVAFEVSDFKNKIHVETKIKNGKPVFNKVVYDLIMERIFLVITLYFTLFLINSYQTNKIGLGIDFSYFIFTMIPFIILSFIQIYRKLHEQCMIYFIWDTL